MDSNHESNGSMQLHPEQWQESISHTQLNTHPLQALVSKYGIFKLVQVNTKATTALRVPKANFYIKKIRIFDIALQKSVWGQGYKNKLL